MMSALLLYSIKSALVLTMLYVPYVLMLRRENLFRFNRLVLLGILLLSSMLVVVINITVDLLQAWLDPRIQAD